MAERKVARRLAAIMAADMVGYSRLVEADEAGTIARQKSHRAEVVDPKIAAHAGRIVKTSGDGLLVEFASAVDAVQCAVEVQEEMAEREAAVPEARRIRYRMGVNLGDIVIDGDDILGDGVNVAARLEALAEPGGVSISGIVRESLGNKLDHAFEDMGERAVKNIARPIRVWRWVGGLARGGDAPPAASEPPALPRAPSIAVLPFDNMSGDPEQDYLADGLAEEIITALSKISEMFVIARNSSFAYKGTSPDVRRVARELGVGHVVEGSVRKAGERVRIAAQLIEAATGHHLWAERYDRELADLFDLQDEITQEVVTALQVRLTEGEQVRLRRRQTADIDAWECYARGQTHLRRFMRQANAEARGLLDQAVRRDPDFAAAWSLLAWVHYFDARMGWSAEPNQSVDRAADCIERCLALDDAQPDAYAVLGFVRLHQRRYDEAIAAGRKAIDLGPSVADSHGMLAMTLNYAGQPAEALALVERAMRLSPFYPEWYLGIAGVSYRLLGRHEEAIAADRERLARNPENTFSDFRLAAVFEELGRHDEAAVHVAQALKKDPRCRLEQLRVSEPYRDAKQMEKFIDLLRKAGLPE